LRPLAADYRAAMSAIPTWASELPSASVAVRVIALRGKMTPSRHSKLKPYGRVGLKPVLMGFHRQGTSQAETDFGVGKDANDADAPV
jgi:hypothetical protein